ncbi:MAG: glycerol-3-phosphate 1-O-acyltransferase PlsY [Halanaerobiales bacterium]
MKIVLFSIIAYLLGSIPSGYLMASNLKNIDLRDIGSGNVGATNVARALGLKAGLFVAILDILKGFVAVRIARVFLPADISIFVIFIIGLLAIAGHNWSIFLNFSGGKGVATTIGVVLEILPVSFFIFIICWITLTVLTRYVSLGSLVGAVSLPISGYIITNDMIYLLYLLLLTITIFITHKENIIRLKRGNENRMSWPPQQRGGNN